MSFKTPQEVRKSFARDNQITKDRPPPRIPKNKRVQRTNYWPGSRLDYEFLDRCKEFICRIPHPTGYYKNKGKELRLSSLSWGHGSYVDIRYYHRGRDGRVVGGPVGILLHLDMISALLPELVALVRRLEMQDPREPEQKASIEVLPG